MSKTMSDLLQQLADKYDLLQAPLELSLSHVGGYTVVVSAQHGTAEPITAFASTIEKALRLLLCDDKAEKIDLILSDLKG